MHNFTVTLDARGAQPMYEQLYTYIVAEITGGGLARGEKLPSKRALSANLSVSLNTVDTAYQMLVAEGWLEARPRSGYYVCPLDALPPAGAASGFAGRPADCVGASGAPEPCADNRSAPETAPEVLGGPRPATGQTQPVPETAFSADFRPAAGQSHQPGNPQPALDRVSPATGQTRLVPETALPGNPRLPAAETEAPPPVLYDFSTSSVDTALFPYKTWGRIQRGILAGGASLLNHGERQGDAALREAVAQYLHEFRAVRCTPAQIVVGAGVEYLIGQLASLLRGCVFALENPGYNRVGSILANSGARAVYVPVDADGLRVEALANSGAQIVCVTPSHQFPTGASMPVGRRTALLAWAGEGPGRYVLEDDYDSEFRFDRKPVPSLQGLDREGRVVYLGTFSRSLAPSIRAAYMVLPPSLLARYQTLFGDYSSTVSRFEQHTIARFIEEGHLARHLARLRVAYRTRRDALVTGLASALGRDRIELRGAHTGLHLLLTVRGALSEAELVDTARAAGVRLTGLSRYYAAERESCPPSTVVLGYSALREPEIERACRLLGQAWSG